MAPTAAGGIAPVAAAIGKRTALNRQQIVGFWAAWFGWMLDGMDSVIYALVLGPALTELPPRSPDHPVRNRDSRRDLARVG